MNQIFHIKQRDYLNMVDFPIDLRQILYSTDVLLNELYFLLYQNKITLEQFQEAMQEVLTRGMATSFMLGANTTEINPLQSDFIARETGKQFDFLANMISAIALAQLHPRKRITREGLEVIENPIEGFHNRIRSYADSLVYAYHSGEHWGIPLPAMPGDGTSQCLTHCKCHWEIIPLDEANGDWDCYWRLGVAEHCQTCIERDRDWTPLRIRNFEIINPYQVTRTAEHKEQIDFIQRFIETAMKGGKGSGHFGHAGRPGLVGGSAPAGAGGGKIGESSPDYESVGLEEADRFPMDSRGRKFGRAVWYRGNFYRIADEEHVNKGAENYHNQILCRLAKLQWDEFSDDRQRMIQADIDGQIPDDSALEDEIMRVLDSFTVEWDYFTEGITVVAPADGLYAKKHEVMKVINKVRDLMNDGRIQIKDGEDFSIHVGATFIRLAKSEVNLVEDVGVWDSTVSLRFYGDTFYESKEFADKVIKLMLKGGKGSGHHGHAGRPGLVGGSAPAGAGGGKISESSLDYRAFGLKKVDRFPLDSKDRFYGGRAVYYNGDFYIMTKNEIKKAKGNRLHVQILARIAQLHRDEFEPEIMEAIDKAIQENIVDDSDLEERIMRVTGAFTVEHQMFTDETVFQLVAPSSWGAPKDGEIMNYVKKVQKLVEKGVVQSDPFGTPYDKFAFDIGGFAGYVKGADLYNIAYAEALGGRIEFSIYGDKGGKGSGHHGHAGRPGLVGGSAPAGAGGGKIGESSQYLSYIPNTVTNTVDIMVMAWNDNPAMQDAINQGFKKTPERNPKTGLQNLMQKIDEKSDSLEFRGWITPDGEYYGSATSSTGKPIGGYMAHTEMAMEAMFAGGVIKRYERDSDTPAIALYTQGTQGLGIDYENFVVRQGFVRVEYNTQNDLLLHEKPFIMFTVRLPATDAQRSELRKIINKFKGRFGYQVDISFDTPIKSKLTRDLQTAELYLNQNSLQGSEQPRVTEFLELKERFERALLTAIKGGKGSGHFGHAGRPGLVGGSAPAGAGGGKIGESSPNYRALGLKKVSGFPLNSKGKFYGGRAVLYKGEIYALTDKEKKKSNGFHLQILARIAKLHWDEFDADTKAVIQADLDASIMDDSWVEEAIMRVTGAFTLEHANQGYGNYIQIVAPSRDWRLPKSGEIMRVVKKVQDMVSEGKINHDYIYYAFDIGTLTGDAWGDINKVSDVTVFPESMVFHQYGEKEFSIKNLILISLQAALKGGKGSGHFGHAGRPGMVGGSAPAGTGGGKIGESSKNYIDQWKTTGELFDGKKFEYAPEIIVNGTHALNDLFVEAEKKIAMELYGVRLFPAIRENYIYKPEFIKAYNAYVDEVAKGLKESGIPYVNVFHATKGYRIDSIKSDGLRLGDMWMGRMPAVYFITDFRDLVKFFSHGTRISNTLPGNFGVIEFRIPVEKLKDIQIDDIANFDYGVKSAFSIPFHVPPEDILSVSRYDVNTIRGGDYSWKLIESKERRDLIGYVPFLIIEHADEEVEKTINRFTESILKGGKGSGHHGHAGRPGLVGGSAPAGAGGGKIGESSPSYRSVGLKKADGFPYTSKNNFVGGGRAVYYDGDFYVMTKDEMEQSGLDGAFHLQILARIAEMNKDKFYANSWKLIQESMDNKLLDSSYLEDEIMRITGAFTVEYQNFGYGEGILAVIAAKNEKTPRKRELIQFIEKIQDLDSQGKLKRLDYYALNVGKIMMKIYSENLHRVEDVDIIDGKAYIRLYGEKEFNIEKLILTSLKAALKGGKGSGHHGHAGRPGLVGGSAPAGAGGGKIGDTPKFRESAHMKYVQRDMSDFSDIIKHRVDKNNSADKLMEAWAKSDYESIVFRGGTNAVILEKSGGATSIQLIEKEKDRLKQGGRVRGAHNHPIHEKEGFDDLSFLSMNDMLLSAQCGVEDMTAFSLVGYSRIISDREIPILDYHQKFELGLIGTNIRDVVGRVGRIMLQKHGIKNDKASKEYWQMASVATQTACELLSERIAFLGYRVEYGYWNGKQRESSQYLDEFMSEANKEIRGMF